MNAYLVGMVFSMFVYIVLGIVISKRVKNVNDFFVAGRQAPTFLIVGSLVASYCSTGLFMGDVGEAYDGFYAPFIMTAILENILEEAKHSQFRNFSGTDLILNH